MWPFFKKKKQEQDTEIPPFHDGGVNISKTRRTPMRFEQLINDMGDFCDFRYHDVALKFWLPEAANEALEEIADRNGVSMSESLRQLFTTHCYGIYAYQVMIEAIPGIFRESAPPMLSLRAVEPPPGKKRVDTYWVPELGKNVIPVKVWIPKRMRHDLQLLADHIGIKLSQYVREIVIARLLGHGTLPMRPEMLKAEPLPAIDDWCEGREVSMRQAKEDEYRSHLLGERRTEWVNE
ncbi:MAG: hypothetical protein EPN14_00715 [Gallionella sp.]|nr:MAG: hypothetical protein EPN14_00715 [Gallionella sp.]